MKNLDDFYGKKVKQDLTRFVSETKGKCLLSLLCSVGIFQFIKIVSFFFLDAQANVLDIFFLLCSSNHFFSWLLCKFIHSQNPFKSIYLLKLLHLWQVLVEFHVIAHTVFYIYCIHLIFQTDLCTNYTKSFHVSDNFHQVPQSLAPKWLVLKVTSGH